MAQSQTEIILTESSDRARGRDLGINPNPERGTPEQVQYIINELAGDLFSSPEVLEERVNAAFDSGQYAELIELSQRIEQDRGKFVNKSGIALGRGPETRPSNGEPLHAIM